MRDSYVLYTDKLTGDYRLTFDKIEMYINTQNFDEYTKEDRLSQLLDVFLSAQQAGKPVSKIVGNNIEEFCKTFCSDFGFKSKILNVIDMLKIVAWGFVIMSILDILCFDWSTSENVFKSVSSVNVSGYMLAIVFALGVGLTTNFVVRSIMFKLNRPSMRILNGITLAIAVGVFAGTIYFMQSGNTNFISCPVWLVLALGIIYLLIYYPLNYKRIKLEKDQKVSFSDMLNTEIALGLDDYMEQRYNKLNKRNIKKGKNELTYQEFLDKEEKDCTDSLNAKLFYYIFPLGITAIAYLFMEFTESFESNFDAVIYTAIMLAVLYPLMLGLWKFARNDAVQRRAWIKAKRKELE